MIMVRGKSSRDNLMRRDHDGEADALDCQSCPLPPASLDMLRSINSSPDPRDHHLRQLLDQHTTHADRFSQFSDAPSTYSRSFFSPRPLDHEPSSAESPLQSPTTSTFSARTPHERLDDPSTSMLDLDDDPRTSVASLNYDDEQKPGDDGPTRGAQFCGRSALCDRRPRH